MRRRAREAAFKIIFSQQFQPIAQEDFKAGVYAGDELNEEDAAYADRLVSLVEEHRDELLGAITEKIERYTENRIYKVDKAIMLMGLAEMKYCDDVPPLVSVTEAAAIARKFSTENSANFVSGVLGGFIQS